MGYTFSENNLVARAGAVATSGTSVVNGTSIDVRGFQSATFVVPIESALAADQANMVKLQGSADNSAWVDIAGSSSGTIAAGNNGKIVMVETIASQFPWVRTVTARDTANCAIGVQHCLLSQPGYAPVDRSGYAKSPKIIRFAVAGTA